MDDRRTLRYEQVAQQVVIDRERLAPGLHHPEVVLAEQSGYLAMALTAYVQTEDAGDPITETKRHTFRYTYALRPWWIPSFLWKRISWAEVSVPFSWSLTVRPRWKYPDSTYVFPKGKVAEILGEPRKMVSVHSREG